MRPFSKKSKIYCTRSIWAGFCLPSPPPSKHHCRGGRGLMAPHPQNIATTAIIISQFVAHNSPKIVQNCHSINYPPFNFLVHFKYFDGRDCVIFLFLLISLLYLFIDFFYQNAKVQWHKLLFFFFVWVWWHVLINIFLVGLKFILCWK